MMVSSRKNNGSYIQTEEQKKKKSIALKELYASGRRVTTDKQRKKFSETLKKTWAEGKINIDNHWAKTTKGREFLSKNAKDKKLGPQKKMSIAAQNRIRTKRETLYTSAKGGKREDLQMYFRSNWEANFARILNYQGKNWVYEKYTFQLEECISYTPDFYVIEEDTFYELKGRMNERSIKQLELMKEKFPHIKLVLICGKEYYELKKEYKTKINWEGK
jgi:hypothetical protein